MQSLRMPIPDAIGIEAALLWSMRAWVVDFSGPNFVARDDRIARLWSGIGLPMVAEYADGMMWALAHGRRRTLLISCINRLEISVDEATLLSVIAGVQATKGGAVSSRLSTMVLPGAAEAVCDSAHRLRGVLNAAGHALPRSETELLQYAALKNVARSVSSPSLLLH